MSCKLLSLVAVVALGFAFAPVSINAQDKPEEPGMSDDDTKKEGTTERPRKGKKGKRKGKRKGGKRVNPREMAEQLGLSPDQMGKVQEAVSAMGQKIREAREGGKLRQVRRQISQDFQGQLKGILTPEQMQKYREMRQARQAGAGRAKGGREAPEGAALVDSVRSALVLSEAEDKALMPSVEKLIKLRADDRKATARERLEFLGFLKQGAIQEDIKARLARFRAQRKSRQEAIDALVAELAPKLDGERTAKLVAFGVLD